MRNALKSIAVGLLFCLCLTGLGSETELCSRLAGTWHSKNKSILKKQIEKFLSKAKEKKTPKNVMALIQPHAGYRFSGQTAAYGIKQIQGRNYKRVIVIGPTHRFAMQNMASVPKFNYYSTPLGKVEIDTAFIEKLLKCPNVKNVPIVHTSEHSVQIQVPLLQYALKDFKLVPIVVGQLDNASMDKLAAALLTLIDNQTLVIASSDFTHHGINYGYAPFSEPNLKDKIKKLDMDAVDLAKGKDSKGFMDYISKTGATICGRNSIALLLKMLPHNAEAQLLHYDTSGRIVSDYTNSVSYVSMMFTGQWLKSESKAKPVATEEKLTKSDKKELLKLARKTLVYYMKNNAMPTPEQLEIKITPGMKQIMGAFVTLHENGKLRGCIGEIVPRRPLYVAAMAHAVNSALRDYRFSHVDIDEIPKLEFEISALTPSKPVKSCKGIVIGKHGMTIQKNGRSAVFLPQVAPEQGWNLEQTLTHLSMKAGLPPDAWKADAKFTVFEAIVFNDKEFKN